MRGGTDVRRLSASSHSVICRIACIGRINRSESGRRTKPFPSWKAAARSWGASTTSIDERTVSRAPIGVAHGVRASPAFDQATAGLRLVAQVGPRGSSTDRR